MPVKNADIAAVFDGIADLLEIGGANPFRIRAYRNAARVVGGLGFDAASAAKRGKLPKLPGFGADLAGKLEEIAVTGTCKLYDELRGKVPAAVTELLRVPGLGPKRVGQLHKALKVRTVGELKAALGAGRVRKLPGFGEKTEQKILAALSGGRDAGRRILLADADREAQALVSRLRGTRGVKSVTVAGSYRRMRETVGDLDILVAAADGAAAVEKFCGYSAVGEVLARGQTRAAVVLKGGLQVDLRVVPPASYGAALHYFTGSKAHNIAVRRLGQAKGLKINEYGVFRGEKRIAGASEKSVFAAVGLPYIPPELREDGGEIEAARGGRLPTLVEFGDLKGDLHVHTRASDGKNSLREMAEAARALGFSYLAITDHAGARKSPQSLDAHALAAQAEEIDALNGRLKGITLLKGAEVDILEDGSLDLPDAALRGLDLVVGSVHGAYGLARRKQTERLLRAMDHKYFTVLGHPTGRELGTREPIAVDMARVIRAARGRGCFLELDTQPTRLDLNDAHCRMAAEAGVLVAVVSDAHAAAEIASLELGIGQARRGWLEAKGVLNTRSLKAVKPLLARTMAP